LDVLRDFNTEEKTLVKIVLHQVASFIVGANLSVIRIELESGTASTSAASLETQDVGPETIDHPGHSPESPKVDQPTSAEAPQAARES
jgi:hypothetical protein